MGMYVMLSSGHILVLYLGLELSSLPLAALAAFNTDSRKSSEAGVKYILSSAFSTGITLFGISLLYGAVGNLGFDAIIQHIHEDALTLTAFVFILSGFAFKMSIVPFHMWTADVFEGAPTPVTNYLAVVSKGSVIFIFITVLYTVFGKLENAWLLAISILSVLSMTVGNIFAMRQQNLKRFLAFSSIAQVGFVLVGIAGASNMGTDSVVYFLVIYLLSNIALFSIVEAISDETGRVTINDYKGLYKSNPFYAIIFTVALFSLAGVPPTAGFFGKLFLLTSGLGSGMYVLLGFATINLVLSLYTYLRVVKAMFIDPEEERMPLIKKSLLTNFVLAVCLIGIIILGFAGVFYQYIDSISSQL
jgi:NADH-quinone oxidoreductase subunit N